VKYLAGEEPRAIPKRRLRLREETMRLAVVGVATLAIAGMVGGVYAQQRGAPRTIFQRADSAVPGYEVVAAGAEFQPGATTGWHTHPGEMVGYVLEGTLVVEQQGRLGEVIS
jgi:quercetin dioxygenase-like cupin family protein